jgi:hypothetical protein
MYTQWSIILPQRIIKLCHLQVSKTGDHHAYQSNAGSEEQRLHVFPHMWKLDLND